MVEEAVPNLEDIAAGCALNLQLSQVTSFVFTDALDLLLVLLVVHSLASPNSKHKGKVLNHFSAIEGPLDLALH